MKPKTIRDAEGNVMYLQLTSDGRLAINVPGDPVKLGPDELEPIRQALADARADMLRGKRWSS